MFLPRSVSLSRERAEAARKTKAWFLDKGFTQWKNWKLKANSKNRSRLNKFPKIFKSPDIIQTEPLLRLFPSGSGQYYNMRYRQGHSNLWIPRVYTVNFRPIKPPSDWRYSLCCTSRPPLSSIRRLRIHLLPESLKHSLGNTFAWLV